MTGVGDTSQAAGLLSSLTSKHVCAADAGMQMAGLLLRQISRVDLEPQSGATPTLLIGRERCGAVTNRNDCFHSSSGSQMRFTDYLGFLPEAG